MRHHACQQCPGRSDVHSRHSWMKPEIFAVNPEQLDMFWGAVLPFIESALERNAYETPQDIYDNIASKHAVLWIVWDGEILAVAVTFLAQRPRAKVCSIFLCTGTERQRWDKQLVARVE